MATARRGFALACVVALHAASPATASADEPPAGVTSPAPATPTSAITPADEKANAVKAKADAAMEAGNFSEALGLYRDAYTISPQPALLYNMGRAEERMGLYTDSLRNLEQFSRAASPELKARVPKLAELLAEVRAHVALVTLKSNVAGARVLLRGKYVATTPVKWALATSGGKAALEVAADGYVPYQKELVLEEGKNFTVDVNLVAKTGAAVPVAVKAGDTNAGDPTAHASTSRPLARGEIPKDEESRPVTSTWWFWTGIGAGVVGGIVLTAVLLNTEKSAPRGDLAPGQASAPLLRF